MTFFFLMVVSPSVQEKAQADIDRIAPNRLPTLDDYDSLPSIIKEVMRWAPVAPLGLLSHPNSPGPCSLIIMNAPRNTTPRNA